MVSRLAVGVLLIVTTAFAGAQESRRRPGAETRGAQPATPPVPASEATRPAAAAATAPAAKNEETARRKPGAEAARQAEAVVAEQPRAAGRRRPGQSEFTKPAATGERTGADFPMAKRRQGDPNRRNGLARIAKPPAAASYRRTPEIDRWRLTQKLGITDYPWWNPYNQNTLKADRPVHGNWFFNLSLVSDTAVEPRRLPTPVAPQGEENQGDADLIGKGDQLLFSQNVAVGLIYYKGDTTFMPPDWEFRFTPVFNFNRAEVEQNRVLNIDPGEGTTRNDSHVGVQELFVDKHLWDVSDRYDFDSLRIGIQPFNADFRGFLFRDDQLGIRLFGNRANNVFLYNIAWFRRIEKDTNSGLNDLGQKLRADDVLVANLYWQDAPVRGFTSEAVVLYNRNAEGDEEAYFDKNGFIQRPFSFGLEKPRNYDVIYLGLNGDGHFGRVNFSGSGYLLGGKQDQGVFVDRETDIAAYFLAAELSFDQDWRRYRLSALFASGDDDPYDDQENGFDAVFENPLFAGADTSFWVRQNVPLIGGGGVAISSRNGVLNDLRSSKDEGQSNFTNPGTALLGIGADFDFTPRWRVSANLNHIAFVNTDVVEAARQQADIDREIGTDISVATIWRPFFTQNIVFRASGAALLPGKGYKQLYGDEELPYSVLLNLTLTY
jgi:hypothetical protein